jgi:hypothetical protein
MATVRMRAGSSGQAGWGVDGDAGDVVSWATVGLAWSPWIRHRSSNQERSPQLGTLTKRFFRPDVVDPAA